MSLIYRLTKWFLASEEPTKEEEPISWEYIGKKPLPGRTNGILYEARRDPNTGRTQYYVEEGKVWV